ncbi:hypothetical protein [Mycobacterium sp. SMC-4]|uniref:hypothetical protein n=1 Tax=Mycobacterium sp. SMC-4 TaxID=2857059 RepID=UPI003D06C00C
MPELMTLVKSAAAGTAVGGLLFTTGLVAHAQPADPPAGPDGLVTVLVGGVAAVDSASLEAAAATVTEVCGGDPAAFVTMAQQVDVEGAQMTACTGTAEGDVLIVQNAAQEAAPAEAPPSAPAEMETPPIAGEEEESEPADTPPVPGEGEADEPFNSQG